MATRDVIVIGGSAGGIEALSRVARGLPADLPAAVFAVIHIHARVRSYLPEILSREGPLPASHPNDGEAIEHGRLYVAPPDHHLVLEPGRVRVTRGPREHGFRPAVDVLFRSAAAAYGPRVIGVILTGSLSDGSAGLTEVRSKGGRAVVQDPAGSQIPSMPLRAIERDDVDLILPLGEIADALVRLTRERIEEKAGAGAEPVSLGPDRPPEDGRMQATAGNPGTRLAEMPLGDLGGTLIDLTCPECGGPLWESSPGRSRQYRCRVGHVYDDLSLDGAQAKALEAALWAGVQSLEERARLCARLAERSQAAGRPAAARVERARAEQARASAEEIVALLVREQSAAGPVLGYEEDGPTAEPPEGTPAEEA